MTMSMKATYKYAVIIAAVVIAATLPLGVSGPWPHFAVGLVCGMGAGMAGFTVMYLSIVRATETGSRGAAFTGIGLKFAIYVAVMFTATTVLGVWAGLGSAAGCLAMPAAILFHNIAMPKLRGLRGQAPRGEGRQYIYEPHIRRPDGTLRYVFMRGAYMEMASGGRIYVTHRRFRKLAAIRLISDGEEARG
jgi:hypothetical protein